MAIFDKTDFWGLKYPLEVRVQHETCSTICGTPVPAILNHKNLTALTGGARESQNMAYLGHIYEQKWPHNKTKVEKKTNS